MSRRVLLSSPASNDLDEILNYIMRESGASRARSVAQAFRESPAKLCETPGLGHRREDLTSLPVLFYALWSYLIIYTSDADSLRVVRIIHGQRDVESLLGNTEQ